MKYGQKQSPEDSIRAWITKATPEGFFLRPLSGNLTPSGIKLIQACHNGDETSLVQQLLSIKQEEYHRIRYAPGGWCLLEEASTFEKTQKRFIRASTLIRRISSDEGLVESREPSAKL